MNALNKFDFNKLGSLFIKLIIILFVGFGLFYLGAFTALVPQFMARLLVFPAFALLILFAVVTQSNHGLSDQVLKNWLIVLLSTMALWPTYFIIKVGGLPSLDARRIVAALSLGATIYLIISRRPIRQALAKFTKGRLAIGTLLLGSYVFLRLASSLMSVSPIYSLTQVFWEILYYYSIFFIAALFFNQQNFQNVAVKVMLILMLIIALYSGIEWVAKKNILAQYAPIAEEFAMFQKALASDRLRGGFFRAQGTFEHPLLLAEFAAIGASFALSTFLWVKQDNKLKWLGIIVLLSAVVAGLLTGSRSALLSLGASLSFLTLVWMFASKNAQQSQSSLATRKILCISTFIILGLIALPLVSLLVSGKDAGEAASSAGRLYMLQLGFESIKSNFLLGVGPGTAGSVAGIVTGVGVSTLDNYFLAIAIESGVPALVLLLLTFLYPAWLAFNKVMQPDVSSQEKIFFSSLLGSVIVIVLVQSILWMPFNLFFIFLFTGVALAYITKKNIDDTFESSKA